MIDYAVIIAKSKRGYSAHVPDLPGCVAVGKTVKEIERLIREAVVLHLSGLHEDRLALPNPNTVVFYCNEAGEKRVTPTPGVKRWLERAVHVAAVTGRGTQTTGKAVRRLAKRGLR